MKLSTLNVIRVVLTCYDTIVINLYNDITYFEINFKTIQRLTYYKIHVKSTVYLILKPEFKL